MRLDAATGCHLTYCTNIHPGETWQEVRANLGRYLPAVKERLSPAGDFGVGLRLSAMAAAALRDQGTFAELQDFLTANGLYVFTINGFPYGPFHATPVKETAYLPDWRDEVRLNYTNLLADLLARLLPGDQVLEGSISTVPGGFKPEIAAPEATLRVAENLVRHAAYLVGVRERTGRTLSLALEPEPCCQLETIDETVDFFENQLFSSDSRSRLATLAGLSPAEAEAALRRHLGVCLDLCHAAVEFEDPAGCLARLRGAGIRIGKMQISAGLRFAPVTERSVELLRPFADAVYLHQVVERGPEGLKRFLDLPQAFDGLAASDGPAEWRVHFHVPIFLDDLGEFATTQGFIREILALGRAQPISPHLEVETYTWDVLPRRYRDVDVVTAIVRELDWVREQIGQ
ncbi:MAG: metabolite traffic protein EboE [Kiloniellaceae bacterium]